MKTKKSGYQFLLCSILLLSLFACKNETKTKSAQAPAVDMDLKRGELVSCGPADKQFGAVGFDNACSPEIKKDFDLGIALLHSFEYDEAEKIFAKVIDSDPECGMAYWGVAMSNYHLLWTPPTREELKKGAKAIEIAKSRNKKTAKESDYILAAAQLYQNWETTDHKTRCLNYEKAMERVYNLYPRDKEAATLYALALNASADPSDTSFKNQKKAGQILDALFPNDPNHPGIVHYIIHTNDNPEMATRALAAARKYASVAPSSAHALHMPSHIFTRLGYWDESINSNLVSVSSAKCYAEQTGIKGHWDEELHSLDYLVYAYLQKGENDSALQQLNYLKSMKHISPVNFKVTYSFAAIPSRYLIENKKWEQAASLEVAPANFNWKDYPWQKALIHFTRLLGSVNSGKLVSAKQELKILGEIRDTLLAQKDAYRANQVSIQLKSSEAWILFKEGKTNQALVLMEEAAAMENKTQKHPVTPCEIIPARELLGDMLLQMNQPARALIAYEACLKKQPNRFNVLYGAASAAEKSNDQAKALAHYRQLTRIVNANNNSRPELEKARSFVKQNTQDYAKGPVMEIRTKH